MFRYLFVTITALCLWCNSLWAQGSTPLPDYVIDEYGVPPIIPEGPLTGPVTGALEEVLAIAVNQAEWSPEDTKALDILAQAKDPRLIWTFTDMLRFAWRPEFRAALTRVVATILDTSFESGRQRAEILNKMIAWDMVVYPGYLEHKKSVFTNYVPGWEEIFVAGDIAFSSADEATWLNDQDIVFGIVINGEARAYPRRIMEVREMVNDTLGGRDLGIPYCTLCGAAQAYFTDRLPAGIKRPILRTSGLLIRSNKVMYDVETNLSLLRIGAPGAQPILRRQFW